MTKKRTGIFGGSFNPVHNGHMAIARGMLRRNVVDEVWLMVSPQNPLKNPASLLPEATRLEMAQLACENEEGIYASDFEFSLPRPSFTWQTLCALREAYPDREFSLLIGADNWEIFSKWYRSKEIMEHFKIAVYPRSGSTFCPDFLPPNVTYTDMPLIEVSSTEIRRRISQGEEISTLVPRKVYEKIMRERLYANPSTQS